MGPGCHSPSAPPRNIGRRTIQSNALLGRTRPERALVFVGRYAGASRATISTPRFFSASHGGMDRNAPCASRRASLGGRGVGCHPSFGLGSCASCMVHPCAFRARAGVHDGRRRENQEQEGSITANTSATPPALSGPITLERALCTDVRLTDRGSGTTIGGRSAGIVVQRTFERLFHRVLPTPASEEASPCYAI